MSDALVIYEVVDAIAFATLNNPDRRNALSSGMMAELRSRIAEAESDAVVKVVVIEARGPVFSSGHDLRELLDGDLEDRTLIFAACTELMESIRLLSKPVIASVQGLATAAGCQLVATCDLAVAAVDASFATPGVDIGLFCTTPGVAVGRAVSTKAAMELLLTGEAITAENAQNLGLINRVVPASRLRDATLSLARKVAQAPSSTVAIGKSAFYGQMSLDLPQAYELAQRVMVDNLQHVDAVEGISAFLEKRPPEWKS